MFQFQPNDQVFWKICEKDIKRCTQDLHTEVAVIGGGAAGLSAAQAFASQGKKVALFEQYYCGGGATGKSTGFITPNSELSFSNISDETDMSSAKNIWDFINEGVEKVRTNIKENNFVCDYQEHKGLLVANRKRDLKAIIQEHKDLTKIGYKSEYFNQEQLRKIIGTKDYFGGITYDNNFGINGYQYCQELKKLLEQQGVEIFEETPILKVDDHTLTAPHATITADLIIICVDKFLPELGFLKNEVYHVQNYVIASEKLTAEQIKELFPENPYMVWDSLLIYNFYRLIENERLILGGGNLFSFYNKKETQHSDYAYKKLTNYFAKTFPTIKINFEYEWAGQIGVSKDIAPLAGADKKFPHIYYIAASAGIPIATALGFYSMQHILQQRTDLDTFLNPYRKYFVPNIIQKIFGKKISFALNHFIVQKVIGYFK